MKRINGRVMCSDPFLEGERLQLLKYGKRIVVKWHKDSRQICQKDHQNHLTNKANVSVFKRSKINRGELPRHCGWPKGARAGPLQQWTHPTAREKYFHIFGGFIFILHTVYIQFTFSPSNWSQWLKHESGWHPPKLYTVSNGIVFSY